MILRTASRRTPALRIGTGIGDGLPRRWIEMMVESIATLAPRFSAHRMVQDYVRQCYLVAAGGLSSIGSTSWL